ncbi:MAG: hypothetical protein HYT83_01485 [Candidatus Levybacteria bacterium]|nr:hypothetical protein [Candidatus Levybacteria bacterium]
MVLPDFSNFYNLAYKCLLELATEDGINASSRDEVFGCLFGRDSAITILKILKVHSVKPVDPLLEICRRTLLTLVSLQGREFNLESGEEPGKFIHEFRRDKYDRLVNRQRPWFVYPDGKLKNYDSIDSTPLTLIALFKYWQITGDNQFLLSVLPSVEAGLNWIITFGDRDKDFLVEYELPKNRKHGGLVVQSWTDSHNSILKPDGKLPNYPIAAVEVQAFAWLAMKLWSSFYLKHYYSFGQKLSVQAGKLKEQFNKNFIIKDQGLFYAAQILDGDKKKIKTITANPLICLWSAYIEGGKPESIVEEKYIKDFVERAFRPDMFVENAGVRTMSSNSLTFNPNQDSYHNGSFWPMLNGLIIEGLENFRFNNYADSLREASLAPLKHFGTPIELYVKKGNQYLEYRSSGGQTSCRYQAWSAAAMLHMVV